MLVNFYVHENGQYYKLLATKNLEVVPQAGANCYLELKGQFYTVGQIILDLTTCVYNAHLYKVSNTREYYYKYYKTNNNEIQNN